MSRIERMREALLSALAPSVLEIEDQSAAHAGHAGARDGRGHYSVRIVAAAFAQRSLLERHRLVYAALNSMLQTDIHALAIHARAPNE